MENNMQKRENQFLQRQKRRKRWYRIIGILSCFVVFCTVYALMLPAITMEKKTYCGQEHTHSSECYVNPATDMETSEQGENSSSALMTAQTEEENIQKNSTLSTDEGTEKTAETLSDVDSEEQQEEETDGIDTFADAGTISAGKSVEIYVGDTVTLQGQSGKKHTWTANPTGCVTIEPNNASAVITGTAAGTVTVTHTTQKGGSETFTVVVLAAEDAEQEISANGSAYTVTLKGKKSVLSDGVTLHVDDFNENEGEYQEYYQALTEDMEDATSETISDDSFAFLKMYHIYLTKDGQDGEYEPEENVNLQVTITYDTPPDGWNKVNWVGHYKKKNGTVSKETVSDGSSTSTGVKKIKVSGNSITFHIQNFSVFSVAALSDDSGGGSTGGGTAVKADGSILTDENLNWIGDQKSNEWQIVEGEYAGNAGTDKVASGDGKVRVQKNVIPTGVENEFLVYLSVDTKQLFADFFASAEYQATTSNNYHGKNLGTVVDAMTGNEKVQVSGKPQYDRSAKFTILSAESELLAEDVTLYWSQANNVTFYLKVKDGSTDKYVLIGLEVRRSSNNVVMLSEEAERLIMSNVAQMATLNQVTDTMGEYMDFVSVVSGNYSAVPSYNEETRTLTWNPTVKENPEIDKVRSDESKTVTWTDHNGNMQTQTVYKYTSWALNTTELVYKVKLAVGRKGFSSAADNMNSKVGDNESYKVNDSAVLSYGENAEMTFPVPYVRGLLYDLQFEKVDKEDHSKKLSGAVFVLTDASGNTYSVEEDSEKSGLYRAVDLPWGSYILTEKSPPSGYQVSTDSSGSWTTDLCYTADRSMQADSDRTQNMMFAGYNDQNQLWQIENEKIRLYVDLLKTDMTYAYLLDGAEFSVYDCDPSKQDAVPMTGLNSISVKNGVIADNLAVEDGKTYYIVETKAPEGYQLPDNPVVTMTVNMKNTTASGQIAVTGGAGTAQINIEKQMVDGVEATVYQIKIPNNPGVTLPKTGGTGTLPYTLSGSGIILGAFMYGYLKKRRQNRTTDDAA